MQSTPLRERQRTNSSNFSFEMEDGVTAAFKVEIQNVVLFEPDSFFSTFNGREGKNAGAQ